MEWFIEKVWPIVREEVTRTQLDLVGADPSGSSACRDRGYHCLWGSKDSTERGGDESAASRSRWLESQSIISHGYVSDDNLESIIARAKVFIVPVLNSTGVHTKLFKSFHYGLPTVMTTTSTHGLEFPESTRDAPAIVVAPGNAEEFANAITTLLADESMWNDARERLLSHAHYMRQLDHAKEDILQLLQSIEHTRSR